MAGDTSLLPLLAKLQHSLESTAAGLPQSDSLQPPANGISLLDTKTELLLSYLQHLTFLILIKLRGLAVKAGSKGDTKDTTGHPGRDAAIGGEVVVKLAELRVYLERGVRPLEVKLKYQIDKVVKAAETYGGVKSNGTAKKTKNKKTTATRAMDDTESSEDDEGDEEEGDSEIDELSYRPNIASLMGSADTQEQQSSRNAIAKNMPKDNEPTGIYRPPRINPTALPTTDADTREKKERNRRAPRSAALDEYVRAEMSTAPSAEPSIGSTIVSGGRRMKTTRERNDEEERRQYEESNFMRLPKEGKKERRCKEGRAQGTFGGEDWRGLSEAGDRIQRLTSRKRGRDGVGGGGSGMGGKSGKRRRM